LIKNVGDQPETAAQIYNKRTSICLSKLGN